MNCDTRPFAVSGVEPPLRASTAAFDSAQAERIYEADFGSRTLGPPRFAALPGLLDELHRYSAEVTGSEAESAAPESRAGTRASWSCSARCPSARLSQCRSLRSWAAAVARMAASSCASASARAAATRI